MFSQNPKTPKAQKHKGAQSRSRTNVFELQQPRQEGNKPWKNHKQNNADQVSRQKKGYAFKYLI
jgi:hypothetical protein